MNFPYLVANFCKFSHQRACKRPHPGLLSRHWLCSREQVIRAFGRVPGMGTFIGLEQIHQRKQLTMTRLYKNAGAGRRSWRNS